MFFKEYFDHGLRLKSRLMKRMPSSNSLLVLIIPFFRKCITRDCGKIPTYPYYPRPPLMTAQRSKGVSSVWSQPGLHPQPPVSRLMCNETHQTKRSVGVVYIFISYISMLSVWESGFFDRNPDVDGYTGSPVPIWLGKSAAASGLGNQTSQWPTSFDFTI